MKNEVEVVTRERCILTLPKERIERFDKHVEARTCFSRKPCCRSPSLRGYEKRKEGIDHERD